ncbi:hypothetical protein AAY473_034825 [Plecturocebus cupreus]
MLSDEAAPYELACEAGCLPGSALGGHASIRTAANAFIVNYLADKFSAHIDKLYKCMPLSLSLRHTVPLCCPGWSAVIRSRLTSISASQVQAILVPQLPEHGGVALVQTPLTLGLRILAEKVGCGNSRNDLCLSRREYPVFELHTACWSAMAQSQLTITSASRVQVILLPQPPYRHHFGRQRWADHLRSGVQDQPANMKELTDLCFLGMYSKETVEKPCPSLRDWLMNDDAAIRWCPTEL